MRLQQLHKKAAETLAKMKAISADAKDRPLTDDERASFDALETEHATLCADIARDERLQASVKSAPDANQMVTDAAEQAAGIGRPRIEMGADHATEKPWASLGEQLMAVKSAAAPGARNIDSRLYAGPSGMNTDVPSEGGFLVQKDQASGLIERAYAMGQVSSRVFRLPISANADGIKVNGIDETSRATGSRFGGVRAYWVGQGDQITDSKPRFNQIALNLEKIAALLYATDEMLKDVPALDAIASRVVPMEINFQVEDAFVNGDGAGKPLGVVGSPCVVSVSKETGQAAATFNYSNVKKMWARMYAPSRSSAAWFINQDVEPQLYSLNEVVGTGGVPVYLPANGASDKPFGTLFGRPVVPIEYAQTLGTVGDVLLADFSQYVAIEKGGIESAASMHVRFIYDEQTFRFIYRVDGEPMWKSALTPKNGTNTLSPFVTLATRS